MSVYERRAVQSNVKILSKLHPKTQKSLIIQVHVHWEPLTSQKLIILKVLKDSETRKTVIFSFLEEYLITNDVGNPITQSNKRQFLMRACNYHILWPMWRQNGYAIESDVQAHPRNDTFFLYSIYFVHY